ncbi:hypothetical protein L6452_19360 [Arctium lappa]|uniref:Uncharacterized protein n=1 Tax=Arctium lappa TaxID=4217 RepID=A0ACB9B9K9_ARCLA|nr:hypothetical protein L6452_19360 [Arctium lappa]
MERYLHETVPQNNINNEDEASWRSLSEAIDESQKRLSGDFDCNICLDIVQDPVVTLCGHLYCWPCIYKWIHRQTTSSEASHQVHVHRLCPVCKSEISQKTMVPLYAPGSTTKPIYGEKTSDLSVSIPRRPSIPRCGIDTMPYQQLDFRGFQQEVPNLIFPTSPTTGMFGEMVYERLFGNPETSLFAHRGSYSLAGISTRRARRLAIQAERSLSRICFFFLCCVTLCLVLF